MFVQVQHPLFYSKPIFQWKSPENLSNIPGPNLSNIKSREINGKSENHRENTEILKKIFFAIFMCCFMFFYNKLII